MPKTQKSLELQNLAKYDVYIEDRTVSSDYFQVSGLPPQFGGGRNSFLINGSGYLADKSTIKIEILDSTGRPIYNRIIPNYTEGYGKMVSVEIYDNTPSGTATIIILGKAAYTTNGAPVPEFWQSKYNVRWVKPILIRPTVQSTSPIRFLNQPVASINEIRFHNVLTASYDTYNVPFSASLLPLYNFGSHVGYGIDAIGPSTFSSDHFGGKITASIAINQTKVNVDLPLTDVLNVRKSISYGYLVPSPLNTRKSLNGLVLKNDIYSASIYGKEYLVSCSVGLEYQKLNQQLTKVPISYAELRISNTNTVSGELSKVRVYSKGAASNADYKIVGDVNITTEELLVSASITGYVPIGTFYKTTNISDNWYAGTMALNTDRQFAIYRISGSDSYYNPSVSSNTFAISSSNELLISSIYAGVPVDGATNKFAGSVSQSGYFIGNTAFVQLFPSTEYTLQFDAAYSSQTASINLSGNAPRLDIYLIGSSSVNIIDANPLGQKIGEIVPTRAAERYEKRQYNFTPAIGQLRNAGIRFVISNGAWYFSNISLKPASSLKFSPDEVRILIPNKDYFNEVMDYKVEFFDLNNNSSQVFAIAPPTFFTGSGIDLGTLP